MGKGGKTIPVPLKSVDTTVQIMLIFKKLFILQFEISS